MAAKADIREKFGLDYLTGPSTETSASGTALAEAPNAEQLLDRAAITYGRQILQELKASKESGQGLLTLNQLVDKTNVERDTLSLVVDRLGKLGLCEIERDKYGNHGVRLTAMGDSFLSFG